MRKTLIKLWNLTKDAKKETKDSNQDKVSSSGLNSFDGGPAFSSPIRPTENNSPQRPMPRPMPTATPRPMPRPMPQKPTDQK